MLDGDSARPSPKSGRGPSLFGPCLLWPNGWMDHDGTWHGGGSRSRPHCARWGPSSPPRKGGRALQFSAHVHCGQTDGCIKMPPGIELDLGPGDFVLDGDPTPLPKKGAQPPVFGLCLLWPNGWMDEDATWYGSRPRPRPHCVRRGPSSSGKVAQQPPLFGPCLLLPRSPI